MPYIIRILFSSAIPTDEEKEQVENLIDKLEDDEDVQNVYSNIA